jgi:hypothetical protein
MPGRCAGAGFKFPTYPADSEWQLILARRTICALSQKLECMTARERALERQLEVQELKLVAVTADLHLLKDSVVYTASNATLKSLTIV